MKKIQPAWRYDLDAGYPSDPEATAVGADFTTTRRGLLGALALGAATVGGALLLPGEARAADATCATSLTLAPRFVFCGGTYGKVTVESPDGRLLATLKKPGEAPHLRRIVQLALNRGGSCTWLKDPRRVAQMEVAIATALRTYYQRHLCASVVHLKAQLAIIPPAAPTRPTGTRLVGLIRRPSFRGCASCSTAEDPENLLLPLGLTVLGLYALRTRDRGHDA